MLAAVPLALEAVLPCVVLQRIHSRVRLGISRSK